MAHAIAQAGLDQGGRGARIVLIILKGSSTDSGTTTEPAKYTTASMARLFRMSFRQGGISATDPSMNWFGQTWARIPVTRLSSTTTLWPASHRASDMWLPNITRPSSHRMSFSVPVSPLLTRQNVSGDRKMPAYEANILRSLTLSGYL